MSNEPGRTRTHADPTLRLAVGAQLAGRYGIAEFLGLGGMGMVYRARDEKLGVDVALKVLRPDLASDPARVERLRREVLLARQVGHDNVVRTHDIGQDGDLWFLTMDFVAGRSLRGLLEKEAPLAPARAVAIVRQVAAGLAAAHRAGVVHRDLSPSNILVDDGGRAWITDFGLAQSLGGGPTQPGTVVGTLDYLAPEQARGEAADGRSDLFALGVILFEMLSGELPFRGGSWSEALAQRLHARPRELAETGVQLPPSLARIVARCLARDPRHRYATGEALLADLERWDRPRAPSRRWAVAAAAGVLALGAALAVRFLGGGEPAPPAPAATAELARAVAVVPLRDETQRPELAWLGSALAERVGESLALAPHVRVVATSRVAAALAELHLGAGGWSDGELGRVAELFGVDRVVVGAVRGSAEKLWVELRLADRSGAALGAESRIEATGSVGELAALTETLSAALRAKLELAAAETSPPESASPAGYAAFAEGAAHLASGDALAAVARLEAAVAADPGFAAAWFRLGLALEALGHDERAIAAAERAAGAAPAADRRLGLEVRALQARLAGDPERARTLMTELAALAPDDVELAIAAGEAAGELGDGDAAERALARAVALDPLHPRAWFLRGKYAIRAGRAREAVDEHLVRALVLQNKLRNEQGRADVLNAFGVGYQRLGELERAEEFYRQAAELRGQLGDRRGHATTLRNLAAIAAIRGDFTAAEGRLAEALAILEELGDRAGIADLYNERGVLEEERGRAAAALDDYRRALELRRRLGDQRGVAESQNNVGYAYFLLGEYDNARAYWQQALSLQREIGDVEGVILTAQSVAQLDLAQGRWPQAARDLLETLESSRRSGLEPAVAVALGGLGRLALYEGRFAAALASYGEALALLRRLEDPRGLAEFTLAEAEAWLELGRDAVAAERLDDAEQWLASGNHEQRAEFHALRAATLARLDDADAARAALASGRDEASASGSRVARLRLDLAAGLVELAAGRPAAAREPLARAVAAAAELDHAWLELHAREALARAALASADAATARRELAAGLRRAERCGLYGGRWRLHAALAASHSAGGEAAAAAAERVSARAELERLLVAMEPAMRSEFEHSEAVRELG